MEHSLDFVSALEAAQAIRRKQVSSVELTRRVFERIDRYNPSLNAFAYQMREGALALAEAADLRVAQGRPLGVFDGVPIHVKESFAVQGHPCTWGLPPFRESRATANSNVVSRLLATGAILVGATNVALNLGDWQSYNPVYGRTNNPWDVERTPGGSSGGSAAALAAGLGYLSVGSDIGGSIRVPAHFCGIFGHKPTLDLVSASGHQPGGGSRPPGFSSLLAVAGPMARSAGDLLAALEVIGGPVAWDAKAWKWKIPEPRGRSLRDFRVGYVIDDPIAAPTPEVRALLEGAVERLGRTGAKLTRGWPAGFQPADLLSCYRFHLDAFLFSVLPPEEQEKTREEIVKAGESPGPDPNYPGSPGALSSFAEWQRQNLRRLGFRFQWQAWFEEFDVFLSPVAFAPAFAHDPSEPMEKRTISTPAGPRYYGDLLGWIGPATLTGCPATVAPVGLTRDGLPVGIQAMGPFWEDGTTIAFADLLSRELGGFVPPHGYD